MAGRGLHDRVGLYVYRLLAGACEHLLQQVASGGSGQAWQSFRCQQGHDSSHACVHVVCILAILHVLSMLQEVGSMAQG